MVPASPGPCASLDTPTLTQPANELVADRRRRPTSLLPDRQRHRQHKHHQQPIGRSGGERRQPLTLAHRQETFHQPASGLGKGGAQGTWLLLDALPQLAAEAEGGSGAEQRQGAGSRGGVERCLRGRGKPIAELVPRCSVCDLLPQLAALRASLPEQPANGVDTIRACCGRWPEDPPGRRGDGVHMRSPCCKTN